MVPPPGEVACAAGANRLDPMNAAAPHRTIPIVPASGMSSCEGAECFALMVLGHSMAPDYNDGDVIVVEPDGLAIAGSDVVACVAGEWMLRRLVLHDGRWSLATLDPGEPTIAIDGLEVVRGVVIQKKSPRMRAITPKEYPAPNGVIAARGAQGP